MFVRRYIPSQLVGATNEKLLKLLVAMRRFLFFFLHPVEAFNIDFNFPSLSVVASLSSLIHKKDDSLSTKKQER